MTKVHVVLETKVKPYGMIITDEETNNIFFFDEEDIHIIEKAILKFKAALS